MLNDVMPKTRENLFCATKIHAFTLQKLMP